MRLIVGVVATLVMVLVLGAVIRRLLGVRVGFVRTLLAGLVALSVAGPLGRSMVPDGSEAPLGTVLMAGALAVCGASVVAMVVLVIAEVIVPDGSLPGPVELWRSWRSRLARTRRYAQVLRIALRHGLGRFLRGQRHGGLESSTSRRELARSLRRALDEGGVTFVKLGQQLSTRRDLLPAEFADEMVGLQDQASPLPWPPIAALIEWELGRPVGEVFTHIDSHPLAAASVAQVHTARLPGGQEVVVKVQRPGVAETVERDLDILSRLAATLEGRTSWGRSLGLRNLASGFAEALREELDFTIERDNMRSVAAATGVSFSGAIQVPTAYPHLCTRRVLVMQRLHGTPLGAAEPVLRQLGKARRHEVAAILLEAVLDQILVHGAFHVDLHPGNVLIQDDGVVGLLDLGSVGRLDSTTRLAIGRLLAALERTDSLAACDALLELVDRPDEIDERNLERAVGALIVRYASGGSPSGVAAFGALFRLVTTYHLGIPPEVAAVFRGLATLEGTLAPIDPDFDLLAQARESGRGRVGDAIKPGRLRQSVEDELLSLVPVIRRLPRRVDRIADAVEHGRLTMNVRLFAHPSDRMVVTGLLHQALLTVLGAAAGVMAVILLGSRSGPELTASLGLFTLFGYVLLIVAVVLVLRVLVIIFRRESP